MKEYILLIVILTTLNRAITTKTQNCPNQNCQETKATIMRYSIIGLTVLIASLFAILILTKVGVNTVIRRSSEMPITGNERKLNEILTDDIALLK